MGNVVFTSLFLVEAILKNIALGPKAYFKAGWNRHMIPSTVDPHPYHITPTQLLLGGSCCPVAVDSSPSVALAAPDHLVLSPLSSTYLTQHTQTNMA